MCSLHLPAVLIRSFHFGSLARTRSWSVLVQQFISWLFLLPHPYITSSMYHSSRLLMVSCRCLMLFQMILPSFRCLSEYLIAAGIRETHLWRRSSCSGPNATVAGYLGDTRALEAAFSKSSGLGSCRLQRRRDCQHFFYGSSDTL